MLYKKIITVLLTLTAFIISPHLSANTDSLISRCRTALQNDITSGSSIESMTVLISEIKKQETLYLKSSLYPDVRDYYEKMLVKLGEYYSGENNYKKALDCYIEADKYSSFGYKDTIGACKKLADEMEVLEIIGISRPGSNLDNKKMLERKMTYLGAIGIVEKKKWEIIDKYTETGFSEKVNIYALAYRAIQKHVLPGEDEVKILKFLVKIIDKNHPIDIVLKNSLYEYLDHWEAYYQVTEDSTYFQKARSDFSNGELTPGKFSETLGNKNNYFLKEAASLERKQQLYIVRQDASGIEVLEISQKLPEIDRMIRETENERQKWRLHKEVEEALLIFDQIKSPKLSHLYSTAEKALEKTGTTSLESPLKERIQLLRELPPQKSMKKDIRAFVDYLIPWSNSEDKIVTFIKGKIEKLILKTLKKRLIKVGGRLPKDFEEFYNLYGKYKIIYKKTTKWDRCISKLNSYFHALKEKNYLDLMILYDESPAITSICSKKIRKKWRLMKGYTVEGKFREYFLKHISRALEDKEPKDKVVFDYAGKLYNQSIKHRIYRELNRDQRNRYGLLYAYFYATGNIKKKEAAINLYGKYPALAGSYSIPKPPALEAFYKENRKILPHANISGSTSPAWRPGTLKYDYKKLEQMWHNVKFMKTEEEVVNYILRRAPIRINRARSALTALDRIYRWHRKWKGFEYSSDEYKALDLIARMQTFADNPQKQNQIYNYLLKRYDQDIEKKSIVILSPSKVEIETIIKNNDKYLELFNNWKKKKKIDIDALKVMDKGLKYSFLTLEQEIQAHYMLATFYEKIPGNSVHQCYHFGIARQMMEEHGISQILLRGKRAVIYKDRLKAKVCKPCHMVKKNQKARKEFDGKYKNAYLGLDDFVSDCPDVSIDSITLNDK